LCVLSLLFSAALAALPTADYVRAPEKGPLPKEALARTVDDATAEQVKLMYSGQGMRVSWLTAEATDSTVYYGTEGSAAMDTHASGSSTQYSCTEKSCGGPYTSGFIHTAHLTPLQPNTKYSYTIGSKDKGLQGSFTMPAPAELQSGPVTFGVIGDLGQTPDSNNTVQHLLQASVSMVVHAGDLSYADCDQPRWDTYGRLLEPLSSQVPWMTVAGNHEVEELSRCGKSMNHSFAAYLQRYGNSMPHNESSSASPQYYSFESAGVHWLMLGSYVDFSKDSEQFEWLQKDLKTVDRSRTPWLMAALHAPWYNSNTAHQHEAEEYEMRAAMEQLLFDAGLDAMFAGHVHAYERSNRVLNNAANKCAPTYFNVGDGGNREGLAKYYEPTKPDWSAYREASFGHGLLTVENATHAHFTWHRDQDDERVVSDEAWLVKDSGCASN